MMTFLNSIIFTLAFAVLIPLLIHLFNRQKRTKKIFSSIRFLKMLEKQRLNKINIYQYLLIIIRTLIVAMLIIAFARPTLITDFNFADSTARTTSIIILDTGINMRYYDDQGMRFDRAVATSKKLLNSFDPEDQIFFLPTHQEKVVRIDSINIDGIKCSYINNEWDNIENKVARILTSFPNFNQEVFIISDNISLPENFLATSAQFPNLKRYIFQIGDQSYNNVSIDSLDFVNDLLQPNQPIELQAILNNTGLLQAENVEINLYINKKREAYVLTNIAAGERKTISLTFQPKEFGFIEGFVEINEDALDADNRFYFNLNIPEELNILFVDQNPSLFLESALKTIDENSNINIKFAGYEQWGIDNFNKYYKIFLSNFTSIDEINISRLNDYLTTGGRLVLMPGYNSMPNSINQLLEKLDSGIRVINLVTLADLNSYFKLEVPSLSNPLIGNLFRSIDSRINNPHFSQYFQVKVNKKVRSLLNFSNRDSYVLFEKCKSGFIYFFTSYVDEAWTDLQYRGIFVPLLTRILSTDNYGLDQDLNLIRVGKSFDLLLKQNEQAGYFTLVTPEDVKIKLLPNRNSTKQNLTIDYLNMPGNYRILNGERTISLISANLNNGRSEIRDHVQAAEKDSPMSVLISENQEFADIIAEARSGHELWKIFIVLAILLIISEIVIIKIIEK
jgi:hypothetical protein